MIDEPVLPPAPSPEGFPPFTSGGGYNLSVKGYNQAYNQNEGVITTKTPKGYKQENEIWLARKEIEQILGISQPAIVKAIKKALLSLLKFFKFNRL